LDNENERVIIAKKQRGSESLFCLHPLAVPACKTFQDRQGKSPPRKKRLKMFAPGRTVGSQDIPDPWRYPQPGIMEQPNLDGWAEFRGQTMKNALALAECYLFEIHEFTEIMYDRVVNFALLFHIKMDLPSQIY
jgi:hypothetical protein